MKNFYKGNRSGADRGPKEFGKRDSGGRGFGGGKRSFGNRDGGGPTMMHKAICSKCGKECQLPFRPSGNRAVFCSACFEIEKNENPERSERKSFDKPAFRTGRSSFEDKKVFEAVCGNCGDNCLVPFRPFPGKPVFCKKCFAKDDKVVNHIVKTDNPSNKNIEQLKSQIEMLNIKLDRILRMLTPEAEREMVENEDEGEMDAEEVELVKMKTKVLKKAKKAKK
jgi:CxxC-x17-CxxC domain-containing protein